MINEAWKDIEGYEGLYKVSNYGRVKSLVGFNGKEYIKREKILKPTKHHAKNNYYRLVVSLTKNKKRKLHKIHRLVAKAFIPNPNNYPEVNHKDGNTFNNRVDNLEWCTGLQNKIHAIETGLRKTYRPTKEELIELYINQRMTLKRIAEENHTDISIVKKFLNKYGIRIRTLSEQDTKYFITKEFLEKELRIKTQKQIAQEVGCDQSLISKYKNKFNI